MNKKIYHLLLLASALSVTACKKSKVEPVQGSRQELSLDSIFLYAKEVYYWNDRLPTYEVFNPRKYTGSTDLERYEAALFGIAGYSLNKYDVYKSNGVYQNYPKFSYISDKTTQNPSPTGAIIDNASLSVDLSGNGNDIGLRVVSYLNSDGSYIPIITAVYENSPADKANIKRGWYISKINGQTYGVNYNNEKSLLNSAMNADNVTLELVNVSSRFVTSPAPRVTQTISLVKKAYKSSPIYAHKIFTAGTKKIGYLNLARFSMLTSLQTPSDTYIDPVFTEFAAVGISDLIIDLRYNGGGYTRTAEYLANLIAPPSLTNKVMYVEHHNSTMTNRKATILRNQPILDDNDKIQYHNGEIVNYYDHGDYSVSGNTVYFKKKGNLNTIQNIIFLVSGDSASSSELLINVLKPYLNVKLVGETTYGKPIGFWPIVIENRYEVYFSIFEAKNSRGEGGYYSGLIPDYNEANIATLWDDISSDFGDPVESYTAQALQILAPGATVMSSNAKIMANGIIMGNAKNTFSNSKTVAKDRVGKGDFIGMIDQPKRKDK